jgi:hypothetical protein
MTRIDTSALSALLRAQLQAKTTNGSAKDPALTQSNAQGQVAQGARQAPTKPNDALKITDQLVLESKWVLRLQAISPDDPERKRKAFRIFLESVLEKELGSAFQSAIQFAQVVEQVLQQIEADPELREQSLLGGDALLEQVAAGPT